MLLKVQRISGSHPASIRPLPVHVRFSFASLFTGVHGQRIWKPARLDGGILHISCRDRIVLKDWLKRTGPYAGDFLIPEQWRRRIFRRRVRSGLATYDDVLPEYREAEIDLYNAETWIKLGGERWNALQDDNGVTFTALLGPGESEQLDSAQDSTSLVFTVEFSERAPRVSPARSACRGAPVPKLTRPVPTLNLPGYPNIETFFSTVPGIVDSCIVREIGMTRATPGAYYWIWAWDNLVTALEMARWDDNETAERIVAFVNSHRDINGAIPGRWTRTFEPLDTPPAGALEFLLLLLALQTSAEGSNPQVLDLVFPHASRHSHYLAESVDSRGLCRNIGYYPDFPGRFGRTENSAVAMETMATYGFCRMMETIALTRGAAEVLGEARQLAGQIENSFAEVFWDQERGFIRDSVDLQSGKVNDTYPLFSLLALQSPHAFSLVRPMLHSMARFARQEFLTAHGTRLLPAWDRRRENEAALSSWYPHWDIYLLKLFRRAGESGGIIDWLGSMERVLAHLRYAPEFLTLDGFSPENPECWRLHGAVSNLNCATGWYRAIIEGLFGIEFDPEEMTVIPLLLRLPPMALRGLRYRGSTWDIHVSHKGNGGSNAPKGTTYTQLTMRIDGTLHRGCTKIPSRYYDGNAHVLEVAYREVTGENDPILTELVNAEVLESRGDSSGAEVLLRALGTIDIVFPYSPALRLLLDGGQISYAHSGEVAHAQVFLNGEHKISLLRRR